MSEECGSTAALAAGRTRKGAGEEGLVSGEGRGCWQHWPWGAAQDEGLLSHAPSWAQLALGERMEGGSGAGRGGKLSRRSGLGRAVRRSRFLRSWVAAPAGCGWSLDSG